MRFCRAYNNVFFNSTLNPKPNQASAFSSEGQMSQRNGVDVGVLGSGMCVDHMKKPRNAEV